MRIKEVNIPDIVLDAQDSGELVIFVGAGVSVDAPSGLPLFNELAYQIAGNIKRQEGEPIDSFLGRLEKRGIDVHKKTLEIIGRPDSRANSLHESIISLFPSSQMMRIVTTNFDKHLSSIVNNKFPGHIETYNAPALPLGKGFTGLVYLHGSVLNDARKMVITDKDVGKAYLNDGWATKFLCEMFKEAVVLFIGYSHNDPAMKYLARGLDNENNRFALTEPEQENHWRFLGIEPIVYPLDNDGRHNALGEFLLEWAKVTGMGLIEREQRIKEIVRLEPPADKETSDYISRMIKNPVTCKFFQRHAKLPGWLIWAEKKEFLKQLFYANSELDDVGIILSEWIAGNFMVECCDYAVGVIQRLGLSINSRFWSALSTELSRNPMDPETRLKWVAILLESAQVTYQVFPLMHLLSECKIPEDKTTALLLFEFLSKPKLKLTPHINWHSSQEDDIQSYDAEISLYGDDDYLGETWGEVFQPHLQVFAEQLEPILALHLSKAHQLLLSVGKANERWDPISFSRSAIEPHDQDKYRKDIDVLINAARDTIECLNIVNHSQALATCNKWAFSSIPLLQRLAIHGIATSTLSADEKINWILDKDWLYGSGKKHEVFVLLKKAFGDASPDGKLKVLDRAVQGRSSLEMGNLDKTTIDYEIYNLLVWINSIDPQFSPTQVNIDIIKDEHSDFMEREHPEFDSWSGPVEWVSVRRPISKEELIKSSPEEKIDWILTYEGSDWPERGRDGLLTVVKDVAQSNFDWGIRFGIELEKRKVVDRDVWNALIMAWRDSVLLSEQWKEILHFLNQNIPLIQHSWNIVLDLLDDGVEKENGKIPTCRLVFAERMVGSVYNLCTDIDKINSNDDYFQDWLTAAINTLCGKVVLFWVKSFSRRRKEILHGKFPTRYKSFFQKIADKYSQEWDTGYIILVSQLHFFYSIDNKWTKDFILPLLDFKHNRDGAIKAWFGYLGWGRWNKEILVDLMPLIKELLAAQNIPEKLWERMTLLLSSIAVYGSTNPLEDGWLAEFINKADEKARGNWTRHISHMLQEADENVITQVWNSWLNQYWQRRTEGYPKPLSDKENELMTEWVVYLEPFLDDAVRLVCNVKAPQIKHTMIYQTMVEKGIAKKHPSSVARLLHHLLTAPNVANWNLKKIEVLYKELLSAGAPREQLKEICEQLARLGYEDAIELSSLLETRDRQ